MKASSLSDLVFIELRGERLLGRFQATSTLAPRTCARNERGSDVRSLVNELSFLFYPRRLGIRMALFSLQKYLGFHTVAFSLLFDN